MHVASSEGFAFDPQHENTHVNGGTFVQYILAAEAFVALGGEIEGPSTPKIHSLHFSGERCWDNYVQFVFQGERTLIFTRARLNVEVCYLIAIDAATHLILPFALYFNDDYDWSLFCEGVNSDTGTLARQFLQGSGLRA